MLGVYLTKRSGTTETLVFKDAEAAALCLTRYATAGNQRPEEEGEEPPDIARSPT